MSETLPSFGDLTQKVQTVNGLVFATRYSYDSAGRLTATTYPDGAVLDAVYDGNGQVAELGVTPNGGTRQTLIAGITYAPFGPATGCPQLRCGGQHDEDRRQRAAVRLR